MKKRLIIAIVALVVIFGGVFGWYAVKSIMIANFFANFVPPPKVISAVQAQSQTWVPYLEAVGTLSALEGADISPEIAGRVVKIFFKDGQAVKAGDPLIQLDDSSEQAQLISAKAQLSLAQTEYGRTKRLFDQQAASQSDLDSSASQVQQLGGSVDNIEASIAKKLLRAPFNGKAGIRQIDVGQFVSAGQLCLSLQAVNALRVDFYLPQRDLQRVALKSHVVLTIDSYAGKTFPGFVSAVDSSVDTNTRTIQVRADVDNSEGLLYPGMFAQVKLLLPGQPDTVVVPQTSITYTLYGNSAYVVTLLDGEKTKEGYPIGTVKRIFVTLKDQQGTQVAVSAGLKAGDLVVNSGQVKLVDGDKVAINNTVDLK
jgi:membrane fusion protein (multidrug efflux system)